MTRELKKVLVVEDCPQHMADAVRILEAAGIEAVQATSAEEAMKMFTPKKDPRYWVWQYKAKQISSEEFEKGLGVDGVLVDLFLPLSTDPGHYGKFAHDNDPTGLVVVSLARKLELPVVICTAGYHHGAKYEWINQLCGLEGINMVDSSDDESEATEKRWEMALTVLRKQISADS